MSGFSTVAIVICSSSLICSILASFVNDTSLKKILNLVMGAFIVCSLLMPIKNAVSSLDFNSLQPDLQQMEASTNDEAYSSQIVSQTESNLETALAQILEQNNIRIKDSKIILALKDDNSIIISSVSIYITKEYTPYVDTICSITEQNFGIKPEVQAE